MLQQVLKLSKKILDSEHVIILVSMNLLTQVLGNQSKFKAAKKIFQQILKLSKKILGSKHLIILVSMNNLVQVFEN